ncbi:MAG: class I SAM-dependent methyltransferase [Acidobacteriia bacterium]|nr:class I SAM-dependent methyltransferase [Terriglobia bacterium]
MSVASHLGIRLADYDRQIRTLIPNYADLLEAAAATIHPGARTIVDLGVGTGALSARCLDRARRARVVGIDADADILRLAARRLGPRGTLVRGSFLRTPLPRADAVVASFALHHVRTRDAKRRLYSRVRAALRRGGRLVSADCHPARDAAIADAQRRAWITHLRASHSAARAAAFLRAWAREDVYVPLDDEVALLKSCGFRVEIVWRKDAFAVMCATPVTRSARRTGGARRQSRREN